MTRTLFFQEAEDLIMTTSNQTEQLPTSMVEQDEFKDDDVSIFSHLQKATEDQKESEGGDGYSSIYSAYDGLESISVFQLKESTKEEAITTRSSTHNLNGKTYDTTSAYYDGKGGGVALPRWLLDTSPPIKCFIILSSALLIGSLAVLCLASGISASPGQTSEYESQTTGGNGGSLQQDQQGAYYNTPPPWFNYSENTFSSIPSKEPSISPSRMEFNHGSSTPTLLNPNSSLSPTKGRVPTLTEVNASSFPTPGAGNDAVQREEFLPNKDFVDFDPSAQPTQKQNDTNSIYYLDGRPHRASTNDGEKNTSNISTNVLTEDGDTNEKNSYHPSHMGTTSQNQPNPPRRPSTQPSLDRKNAPTTTPFPTINSTDVLHAKMNNDVNHSPPPLERWTFSPTQTPITSEPALIRPISPLPTKGWKKSHITKFYVLSKNRPKGDHPASLLSSLPKEADFLIHLGNWNTRKRSRCNANAYQKMSETYRKSPVPVLFVVSTILLALHTSILLSNELLTQYSLD